MLKSLKEAVYEANMELPKRHLVTYTWGNVSGISREKGLVVIKPSGVEYDELSPDKLVVLDLDGNIVEGKLNPSSDTKTHLELYKQYPDIGGIVHTHSPYAVGWAQACEDIPCYGTTHADYFYGAIPCARHLTTEEIDEDYEKNTGKVIIEELTTRCMCRGLSARRTGRSHGARTRHRRSTTPLCWKKWRKWRCTRGRLSPTPPPRRRTFKISIFYANTARTPTTGKNNTRRSE